MKKKIILFGSSGLIGSSLKKYLEKHHDVIGIDKVKKKSSNFLLNTSNYNLTKKKIAQITKKFRKIDAVIICVYPRTSRKKHPKSLRLNFKDFSKEINTHLEPFYNLNKIFIDYFKKKGGGSIINFASIYGSFLPRFEIYKDTNMDMPLYYAMSKSSLIMMTKYLAKINLKNRVRINSVSPGGIFDKQNKKFIKKYSQFCSNKNLLKESDLNGIIEFLISDYSKKITGQDFIIDDGFTL